MSSYTTDEMNNYTALHNIHSNRAVTQDLILSLCGKHLGEGMYRSVYEYKLDENYVIKLESIGSNCNLTEYMMWNEIQHLSEDLAWVKKWFAPVKWISPNGRVLVMKRTVQKYNKKRPDKVPSFMWDVKEDNFGWIGNNFVCHDYGQFYNFIHYPKRMKKAKWYE